MSTGGKAIFIAVLIILAMGIAQGVYYVNTTSVIAGQEQTISGLQLAVSSFSSHPVTSTTTIVTTTTIGVTSASTSTTALTQTSTQLVGFPWTYALFMDPPKAGCSGICFGQSLNDAIHFNCPMTKTQSSCAVTVYDSNTMTNYSFVAKYPVYNQPYELPEDNCEWNAYFLPSYQQLVPGHGFGYCAPIDSISFVLAEEMPPHL